MADRKTPQELAADLLEAVGIAPGPHSLPTATRIITADRDLEADRWRASMEAERDRHARAAEALNQRLSQLAAERDVQMVRATQAETRAETAEAENQRLRKALTIDPKQGGDWLAAARSWLQWNTINGSIVLWGSDDEVRPPMTVRQVEEMAAKVAQAVARGALRETPTQEPTMPPAGESPVSPSGPSPDATQGKAAPTCGKCNGDGLVCRCCGRAVTQVADDIHHAVDPTICPDCAKPAEPSHG